MKYLEWAANFLQMRTPIVLYTEENLAPLFQALRPVDLPLQIYVRPFQDLETWKLYERQWYQAHEMDHERAYHSPQLYSIWAQKAWCVKEVVETNPFRTRHFFWCDVGAFRQGPPHPLFPQARYFEDHKILLNSVQPLTAEDHHKGSQQDFSSVNRIVGGLWGGGKEGCLRWHKAFQSMLERYFVEGRFAGKDQSVMLSAYLADPTLASVVRCTRPEKDHWFFLEDLLADQALYAVDESYAIQSKQKPIVSVSIKGGLGNQMFQIATAYALAKRTGAQLVIPRKKPEADSRPTQYWDTVLAQWQPHLVQTLADIPALPKLNEKCPTLFQTTPNQVSEPGLYLEGYWQTSKYFQGAEEDIRLKMSASEEAKQAVKAKWGWILEARDRVVLVHARRTDYLKAVLFHGPLTAQYYKKATEKMLETVRDPLFLLVSDDPQFWSEIRGNVPAFQTYDTIQLQSANDVETLTLLQQLKYFILANSTFSWWGAWLAGPQTHVIAPNQWFGPTGPKPEEYEDIYESHWVRIDTSM